MTDTIQLCPICENPECVRLAADWQAMVEDGKRIPIVGCGNPWHYMDPAIEDAREVLERLDSTPCDMVLYDDAGDRHRCRIHGYVVPLDRLCPHAAASAMVSKFPNPKSTA